MNNRKVKLDPKKIQWTGSGFKRIISKKEIDKLRKEVHKDLFGKNK